MAAFRGHFEILSRRCNETGDGDPSPGQTGFSRDQSVHGHSHCHEKRIQNIVMDGYSSEHECHEAIVMPSALVPQDSMIFLTARIILLVITKIKTHIKRIMIKEITTIAMRAVR